MTYPTGTPPPLLWGDPVPVPPTHLPTPYTVVIDTREQRPFAFASPLRRARQQRTYTVQTTTSTLKSGDYSLAGFESRIAVERKSISDLFSTLAAGRSRFQRELERLSEFTFSAIVVEAEWGTILTSPPPHSRLPPRTLFMTVVSWQQKFPRVHWWFLPSREVAEACTIRILDKFWYEHATNTNATATATAVNVTK